MPRLFIALRPPPPVRSILLATMHGIVDARWQEDEQLHITLHFLGEVDHHVADDIALVVQRLSAPPLRLSIDGVGLFGSRHRPRSLWAAITKTPELLALHRQAGRALSEIGLPGDGRAFMPHITLARLNRASGPIDGWMNEHPGLRSPPFAIDHVYLYESELGSSGSTYSPVLRQALS